METDSNSLRDRLLSQSPLPGDLAGYREQVSSLVDANQKRLRRERILTTAFWIFCAVSATAWLWFDAGSAHQARGPFLACIFFIWGGVEILKHHINTARVDLLREIKQLQLQMFALETRIPKVQ